MVNRIRTSNPGNAGHKQDTNNSAKLLTSTRSQSTERQDDLIVSLAEQYENRRARQVGEWERLYGQNVYRTF
jgi:hypothetical protein